MIVENLYSSIFLFHELSFIFGPCNLGVSLVEIFSPGGGDFDTYFIHIHTYTYILHTYTYIHIHIHTYFIHIHTPLIMRFKAQCFELNVMWRWWRYFRRESAFSSRTHTHAHTHTHTQTHTYVCIYMYIYIYNLQNT